ncbi:uncharacterized protein [Rutidosis leptorrhynchoides]|uniref:uncharacterized protein n=1 Tax=Rutidosis leptorrhynchoides TaxID=125765 RepID=UPI003A99617F
MGHRRELAENHPYRKKSQLFDGTIEDRKLPPPLDGETTLYKVANINVVLGKKGFGPPEGLLLNIPRKTKDGIKVRRDMEIMKIRPTLQPKDIDGRSTKFLPPACYTMSKFEKTKLCECLHGIKVPSGYSANIRKLVSMKDLKLLGMKSHDCHVIDPDVLDEYQRDIILTLCKLEMYFPPSLFDVMVHLVSHIVGEIKACGPVFLRMVERKVRRTLLNIDKMVEALGFAPKHVIQYQGYDINEYTLYTKYQDKKKKMQNSGVTVIASSTEFTIVNREERSRIAKKSCYGVIQEIWELDYGSYKIPLFKRKWVDTDGGVQVDEDGFTTVNLSTDGYASEPFFLAKLVTQIVGVENVVDEDEYDQFDELPPFSVGVEPLNEVVVGNNTIYFREDHEEGGEVTDT